MGAKVIAAASSQEKIDICLANGADEAFIYPSGNLSRDEQKELSNKVKELTGGLGPNVIYDPVGGSYAEPCLRSIAWEGRYLVIGFAAGADQIPKMPLNLNSFKRLSDSWSFFGAPGLECFLMRIKQTFNELFELYSNGKIDPTPSDRFSLDRFGRCYCTPCQQKSKRQSNC